MNRFIRTAATGVGIVIVFASVAVIVSRSNDTNNLARYKAELRARGEKLTYAELGLPRSTNSNEGAARARFATNKFLLSAESGFMRFTGPGKAALAWSGDHYVSYWHGKPSTNIFKDIGVELAKESKAMAEILELSQEPWLDSGVSPAEHLTGKPIDFVRWRQISSGLSIASIYHLNQGQFDEALEMMHGVIALAQLYEEDRTLVTQMVLSGIAEDGLNVTWEALQAPGWNDQQLDRTQKHWERIDLIEALERGVTGNRALNSHVVEVIKSGKNLDGSSKRLADLLVSEMTISANELYLLREGQFEVETVRRVHKERWTDVRPVMETQRDKREDFFNGRMARMRFWLSRVALANTLKAAEVSVKRETQRQMTIAAIAIKRYELRHGKAPESLEALVPEFLEVLPHDFMSAKPLRYRLNADGSYVLYSVGEDGKDDGGDANPPKPVTTFDLWSGRDAVWPVAVTNEPVEVRK